MELGKVLGTAVQAKGVAGGGGGGRIITTGIGRAVI